MKNEIGTEQLKFLSCVIDHTGTVLSTGPEWELLLQSASGGWIGKKLADCVVAEDRLSTQQLVDRVTGGQNYLGQTIMVTGVESGFSQVLNLKQVTVEGKNRFCLNFECAEVRGGELEFVLQSSTGVPSWHYTLKTRQIAGNSEMFDLFGVDPDEVKHDPEFWTRVIHPEDQHRVEETFRESIKMGRDYRVRFRIQVKEKGSSALKTKYILSKVVIDFGEHGEILGARGVNFEVGEKQYSQRQKSESLYNVEDIFENLQVGLVVQEQDGKISSFNKKALEILGLTEEELFGRTSIDPRWHTITENGLPFPGENHPAMITLRSGTALVDMPMGIRKSDGNLTWLSINTTPIFETGSSKPTRVVATFTDVTERTKALNTLRDQSRAIAAEKQRFEHLIYGLNQTAIVSLTDLDGNITYANEMFCKISGYDESELVGRNHRLINSGIHPKEFFGEMWNTVLNGLVWRKEICNKRKDGSLYWVDSTIIPLKNAEGRVQELMAIRFDVTAVKETKLKLLQASKMAALGEASAHLAHEVNTPLAVILGKISKVQRMLSDSNINTSLLLNEMEKMQKTALQINEVVKGLKHFSRSSERDEFQVCDLDQILRETFVLCGDRLEQESVQMIVQNGGDLKISARPAQIYQVLLNLINNSIDAIQDREEKWIEVATKEVNDKVLITVTDCGDGISGELVNKIMEPFFTTKGVEKGTGLGLSVSAEILTAHHGRLYIDQSCKNTRFVLELPKVKQSTGSDEKRGVA